MNQLTTLAEQQQHYAAVRARLRGYRPSVVRLVPKPEPMLELAEVETEVIVAEPPPAPEEPEPLRIAESPLNMLSACSWRFLAKLAALRNGIDIDVLLGPSRAVEIVAARSEAMYLVALHTRYSIAQIGVCFNRDHTSVLHALKKFPPLRERRTNVRTEPFTSPEERERHRRIVAEGYAKGTPVLQIAAQAGISRDMVLYHARRQKLTYSREFRKASYAGAGMQS